MKLVSIFALTLAVGAVALGAPPKKPTPKKPTAKPTPAKPQQPGVKGASQMAGGAIRFGDLFALRSGFTYQILSARYSLDPLNDYEHDALSPDEKFLILKVAIKNNRQGSDNDTGGELLQAVDATNKTYDSGRYSLASKPGEEFSVNLKPGQGLGQGGVDPLEVSFKVNKDAKIVKLILKNGREGTKEEVLRFFLAGATEAEAGGKPDPKNIVSPLPAWASEGSMVPVGQPIPSYTYFMTLTGFSTATLSGEEAEEGKKWIFANIKVKNPWKTKKQGLFDFYGGDNIGNLVLIDGDGEKYHASKFLKAKKDEQPSDELDPNEEVSFRIGFQVPSDATFKTAKLGSSRGHLFVFDASTAGK
ncbi:MAG: hypothetical protein QM758_14650 [Armatimonas sp.]